MKLKEKIIGFMAAGFALLLIGCDESAQPEEPVQAIPAATEAPWPTEEPVTAIKMTVRSVVLPVKAAVINGGETVEVLEEDSLFYTVLYDGKECFIRRNDVTISEEKTAEENQEEYFNWGVLPYDFYSGAGGNAEDSAPSYDDQGQDGGSIPLAAKQNIIAATVISHETGASEIITGTISSEKADIYIAIFKRGDIVTVIETAEEETVIEIDGASYSVPTESLQKDSDEYEKWTGYAAYGAYAHQLRDFSDQGVEIAANKELSVVDEENEIPIVVFNNGFAYVEKDKIMAEQASEEVLTSGWGILPSISSNIPAPGGDDGWTEPAM